MKVYLIVYPCEDGVHVCAAEVDHEKAEKLYKIYHDDDKEVYLEEYDTEDNADMLAGKIPYVVEFSSLRKPAVHLTCRDGEFPRVRGTRFGLRVFVEAASKDEAYQEAVVIHRDYVTEKDFR